MTARGSDGISDDQDARSAARRFPNHLLPHRAIPSALRAASMRPRTADCSGAASAVRQCAAVTGREGE